jgi:1,2-diacylglycerol 3-alpha-glucosyltransferase
MTEAKTFKSVSENVGQASSLTVHGASLPRVSGGKMPPEPADKMSAPNFQTGSKVAVLFHRLGPYHFARLRAAGQRLSIVAVESSGADETYAWDKVGGADRFERVTVFEDADAQRLPAAEVASRVGTTLDKIQPTVVVIPGWSDSAALGALCWCVQNRIPAVVMSESTAWDEPRNAWKEFIKRQIVGLGSSALAGGKPHKAYLTQLGMPAERVFLGYDAVDNRHFEDKVAEVRSQSSVVRGQFGLPSSPFFLASARFVEMKNLPRLLEAYAHYRQLASNSSILNPQSSTAPWDLVLLGDGPLRSTLHSSLSTLNLHEHAQMPGFKQYDELPAYYALASGFVHASTKEPWGLVVNEAMAAGLPVLVSNRCGCAADLMQEGVNGFTFDPYNVEQLAQLMVKISAFEVGRATPCAPQSDSEPSSIIHHPSSTLMEMGNASRAIIANWGPDRFAEGLKQAVEMALYVGPIRPSLLQRNILKLMPWK